MKLDEYLKTIKIHSVAEEYHATRDELKNIPREVRPTFAKMYLAFKKIPIADKPYNPTKAKLAHEAFKDYYFRKLNSATLYQARAIALKDIFTLAESDSLRFNERARLADNLEYCLNNFVRGRPFPYLGIRDSQDPIRTDC